MCVCHVSAGFPQKRGHDWCHARPPLPPTSHPPLSLLPPLPPSYAKSLLLNAETAVAFGSMSLWMDSAYEAFYCFLHQPEWMALYLRGQQDNDQRTPAVDLHEAIINTAGWLPNHLTAVACLTLICKAEAKYGDCELGARFHSLRCPLVRFSGCMAAVVHTIEKAVKVGLLPRCSCMQCQCCLGCYSRCVCLCV